MIVPFEQLSPDSRIWIYQSNRQLSAEEEQVISNKSNAFLIDWTAHGNSLQAAFQLMYHQFLVIGVNEAANEASGCSIDKCVRFVQELGESLNIDLMTTSKVAIRNNAEINLIDFSEIRKMVDSRLISGETEVFNNTITTKREMENSWLQPASESWLKRYL